MHRIELIRKDREKDLIDDKSIYDVFVQIGYRTLTEHEKIIQLEALDWLHKKRIPTSAIACLLTRKIDIEGKRILFEWEGKSFRHYKIVKYGGSPFDRYMTEVFPRLKSKLVVFPTTAWCGGTPSLGFHVKIDRLQRHFDRKRVFILETKSGIINLTNQLNRTLEN